MSFRNIDRGDAYDKQEEIGWPVVAAQRHTIDLAACVRWIQRAGQKIEGQQHPDEPDGAAWPGADGDRLPPERGEADIGCCRSDPSVHLKQLIKAKAH